MSPEEELEEVVFAGEFEKARDLLKQKPSLLNNRILINQFACGATSEDRVDVLGFLVSLGMDLNSFRKLTAFDGLLYKAAIHGQTETVRWLIEHGCEVMPEYQGHRHSQALVAACLWGHLATVKVLVEAGSDVNSVWEGNNALSFAVARGHEKIVKYLRSKGAKTPEELGVAPVNRKAANKPKKRKK